MHRFVNFAEGSFAQLLSQRVRLLDVLDRAELPEVPEIELRLDVASHGILLLCTAGARCFLLEIIRPLVVAVFASQFIEGSLYT